MLIGMPTGCNTTTAEGKALFDALVKTQTIKTYTIAGGEMTPGDGKGKTPVMSDSVILKDGVELQLNAFTINEDNYFRLRDIGQTFNIGITWDETTRTIGIDTAADYIVP